jgi:dihydrofolate synthase/folylpolyglutamate synthase
VVTPLVSVITSVSMDHEAYLGNSLIEIAGEKAGIINEGVPVVSAAVHPEVIGVIKRVSNEKKAELYRFRQDFDYTVSPDNTWIWKGGKAFDQKVIGDLRCNRSSLVQQENDSLAIAVLQLLQERGFKVSEQQLIEGLAEVSWPGRMEYFEQEYHPVHKPSGAGNSSRKLRYLLDGAHNPAGVKNMAKTLAQNFKYGKVVGVWGTMIDKDLALTLGEIVPLIDKLIITQPDGERSATPEHIYSLLSSTDKGKTQCITEVAEALARAQDIAEEDDLIIVGGSLYLIGAVRYLISKPIE